MTDPKPKTIDGKTERKSSRLRHAEAQAAKRAKEADELLAKLRTWMNHATMKELAVALTKSRGVAYKMILEEYQTRKNGIDTADVEALKGLIG